MASYQNTSCVKIDENIYGLHTKYKTSIFNDMSAILDARHQKAVEITRNSGGRSYNYITRDDDGYFRRDGPKPLKIKGKFDILIQTFEHPSEGRHDIRNARMKTNDENTCGSLD